MYAPKKRAAGSGSSRPRPVTTFKRVLRISRSPAPPPTSPTARLPRAQGAGHRARATVTLDHARTQAPRPAARRLRRAGGRGGPRGVRHTLTHDRRRPHHVRTPSGAPITDTEIEVLTAEAEEGYDGDRLIARRRKRGRPALCSSPATIESVRLDLELRSELLRRARSDGTTPSEIIRERSGASLRAA